MSVLERVIGKRPHERPGDEQRPPTPTAASERHGRTDDHPGERSDLDRIRESTSLGEPREA